MALRLTWEIDGRRTESLLAGASLTVGREADNDLVLSDRSVSRYHARLDAHPDGYRIQDLGSVNGVWVNEAPIEPGAAGARPLADGDVVRLGNVVVRVSREAPPLAALAEDADLGPVTVSGVTDFEALVGAQQAAAARAPGDGEALARALRTLELLASLSRKLVATEPPERVLEAVAGLVLEATPFSRAAVVLWDETLERLVPKVVRERHPGRGAGLRIPSSLVQRAFAERRVVQTSAAPTDGLTGSMLALGVGSAVAVPLGDGDRAIGVVYADSALPGARLDDFGAQLLAALAGHAALAIEQGRLHRRLRHEERVRARLERYLPRAVVDDLLVAGETSSGLGLKARSAEATILFCDMTNFTGRTESLAPEEVMLLVNRFFGRMTQVIFDHEGTLDKYIGDCVMAVFGAPRPQADHARKAARAALALREAVRGLAVDGAGVGVRIGMNSGRVIAGDVGHVLRREWTVLGSAVNLAARMESSVAREGQIVLTGETRALLGDAFLTRPLELRHRPKGISRDFSAWELLGERR